MTNSTDDLNESVHIEDRGFKVPNIEYKLLDKYPHDLTAFTEGLVFYKDTFYESTGRFPHPYSVSTLRQVEIRTGGILRTQVIRSPYFAEGLTIFRDRIFLLTNEDRKGFVYSLETFNLLDAFHYEFDGWGLTNDGQYLIMSDGSNKLRLIDPESFKIETQTIDVHIDGKPLHRLNELEYIDGSIYANVFNKDIIVRINPKDGAVTGQIDLSDLRPAGTKEVLNGIAYDKCYKRLFVTGKYWPWVFQICLTGESA
jgi:glutaminyl-peptide cyclotransferase